MSHKRCYVGHAVPPPVLEGEVVVEDALERMAGGLKGFSKTLGLLIRAKPEGVLRADFSVQN